MSPGKAYNEDLLHWIWENRQVKNQCTSTNGKEITIQHPGYYNGTDGPDFKNARIAIGNITFHGDIEIHWSAQDWNRHGHHADENYNRVILHVVYNQPKNEQGRVRRQEGTAIPTLCIQPVLSKSLQTFFEKFQEPTALPCSGNISYISTNVFEQQIDKAHTQYFEQKIDDLLCFYEPGLPVSEAWKKLTITALFYGLGIAHNREPMRQLASLLFDKAADASTQSELIALGLRKAGLQPKIKNAPFNWNRKGSRPNNHPRHRVAQACELLWIIKKSPLKQWFRTDIEASFDLCRQKMCYNPGLGSARAGILFGTVWIPAMYVLGDLLYAAKQTSAATKAWLNYHTTLPASIVAPFEKAGFPTSAYRHKLGTVHQLRAYCRPQQCQRCKVFKNVISS